MTPSSHSFTAHAEIIYHIIPEKFLLPSAFPWEQFSPKENKTRNKWEKWPLDNCGIQRWSLHSHIIVMRHLIITTVACWKNVWKNFWLSRVFYHLEKGFLKNCGWRCWPFSLCRFLFFTHSLLVNVLCWNQWQISKIY